MTKVAIVFLVSAVLSIVTIAQSRPDKETAEVSLREALWQAAAENDCVFTLEYSYGDRYEYRGREFKLSEWMEMVPVKPFDNHSSLQDYLRELTVSVPRFSFQIDQNNPRVIHIIDSRLKTVREYALAQTVKQASYDGLLHEFPDYLGGMGFRISSRRTSATTDTGNLSTTVHLRRNNSTIRDLLTTAFPMDKRTPRILWTARTLISNNTTRVHFTPQLPKNVIVLLSQAGTVESGRPIFYLSRLTTTPS